MPDQMCNSTWRYPDYQRSMKSSMCQKRQEIHTHCDIGNILLVVWPIIALPFPGNCTFQGRSYVQILVHKEPPARGIAINHPPQLKGCNLHNMKKWWTYHPNIKLYTPPPPPLYFSRGGGIPVRNLSPGITPWSDNPTQLGPGHPPLWGGLGMGYKSNNCKGWYLEPRSLV